MSAIDCLDSALRCPLCRPQRPLRSPITLRCGHTLCADHVLQTSDSPALNASSTPNSHSHLHWSACTLDECAPSLQPRSPSSSGHRSEVASKSDSVHSDRSANPKIIFLPSHAPNFEDRYDNAEKHILPPDSSKVDVLVNKLLALNDRYQRTIHSLDNAFRNLGNLSKPPRIEERDSDSSVPRYSETSTPSSSGLSSPSSLNVSQPQYQPEWQALRADTAIDSPDPETEESFLQELYHELSCEICLMLLYKPITTPCQHTFCSACLSRSLDHSDRCPLCRQDLFGYAYFQGHPVNRLVSAIAMDFFPEEYQERDEQVEKEGKDARFDTPLFICQLSFPGMPTLLHFFEPRYRLMLRRCLQQENPSFGMLMPAPPGGTTDYGTMLEIRSVQMLPDGRSMVETFGAHRFRVVERGTIDGYMVGRIERIDDVDDEVEGDLGRRILDAQSRSRSRQSNLSASELTNEEMIGICRAFVDQLRSGMTPWVVQRLNHTYGPMPDDVSDFTFWMGLILPLDEQEKAKLLPIRSTRLRLRLLVHWIEQLNSQWWFMSGCTVM